MHCLDSSSVRYKYGALFLEEESERGSEWQLDQRQRQTNSCDIYNMARAILYVPVYS